MQVSTIPDLAGTDGFRAHLDLDGCSHAADRLGIADRGRYSDRVCSPDETFLRVSPLLRGYGVTRVACLTELDRVGIPVWSAMRPNSLSLAVNQGKGITDADARTSAVMEALERAVAGEPEIGTRFTSRADLNGKGLITDSLDGLIGRGQTQLSDSDMLAWVEGYDLITKQPVWVPHDAILLDRTIEMRFWQSSDGLASGNTVLEATFHGLLERIERDADVLWSLTKSAERAGRCVNPQCFGDAVVDHLVSNIRNAGLRLQLFDITSDIRVPCFQALIGPDDILARRGLLYVEIANGSGCHPDPVRAVIRAITEAAQSRLTLVSGSRDDIAAETYSRPMPKGLIEDFSFSPLVRELPPGARDDRPIATKLQSILQALTERAIMSAIVVPLNASDAAFAVVKVLVPSLENPPGERQRRFGSRALAKMIRFG